MSEYLPQEVRDGLEHARREAKRKKSRLRVEVGGQSFTILRFWENGFSIDPAGARHFRGLVDVYDGARHVSNCLVVASSEEAGELVYEYKRSTPALEAAPSDYEISATAPIGLLAKS